MLLERDGIFWCLVLDYHLTTVTMLHCYNVTVTVAGLVATPNSIEFSRILENLFVVNSRNTYFFTGS